MLKCFIVPVEGTHITVKEIWQLMTIRGQSPGFLCIQPIKYFECSSDSTMPLEKLAVLSGLSRLKRVCEFWREKWKAWEELQRK